MQSTNRMPNKERTLNTRSKNALQLLVMMVMKMIVINRDDDGGDSDENDSSNEPQGRSGMFPRPQR